MLDASNPYYLQMALLMDLLRFTSSETCFALKGGTAINLFYRDLPFLLTFKSGDPDWSGLGLPDIEKLPSVQWKLQNVKRMDSAKREKAMEALRKVLKIQGP